MYWIVKIGSERNIHAVDRVDYKLHGTHMFWVLQSKHCNNVSECSYKLTLFLPNLFTYIFLCEWLMHGTLEYNDNKQLIREWQLDKWLAEN